MAIEIAVLKDGWVFVGNCERHDDGRLTITVAYDIRTWGTTEGLGQIALNGPTKDTVLDVYGTVWAEAHDLKFRIPCVEDKWKKALKIK